MVVEEVFEDILYPELKEYIEENNDYDAKVTKAYPQTSKVFPIIPIKLLPITNRYNNLNYGEETYSFGVEIEVFAMDKVIEANKVSRKTICDDLVKLIVEYIKEHYHFTIRVTHDVPNADTNIYRNLIRLTGTLDTKYTEYSGNLVIYPW